MTVLTRNPSNTNPLQPTKFLLTFSKIPAVQYFCQSINLPGLTLAEVVRNTPVIDTYYPGTKLTYNKLDVTFIVDEALQSWKNMHDWFRSIAPVSGGEKERPFSDATLTILTALNNPIVRIQYRDVFPTTLSDITFDTTLSAETIIKATASFRYDYYDILTP